MFTSDQFDLSVSRLEAPDSTGSGSYCGDSVASVKLSDEYTTYISAETGENELDCAISR